MDQNVMWAIVGVILWGPPVLALSIRFALKPIVEAIKTLREPVPAPSEASQRRIEQLESEIARLAGRLESVERAEAFHRELKSGSI